MDANSITIKQVTNILGQVEDIKQEQVVVQEKQWYHLVMQARSEDTKKYQHNVWIGIKEDLKKYVQNTDIH